MSSYRFNWVETRADTGAYLTRNNFCVIIPIWGSSPQGGIMENNLCQCCSKVTTNPKFCGHSCAAKINNKSPKRKRIKSNYFCAACGTAVSYSRKYCKALECQPNYVDWSDWTLSRFKSMRKYQRNSRIRQLSRKQYMRSSSPKRCAICDYDTHFEVCHIRGNSDLPDTALLSEINHVDNLVALCKNHHWEMDHGIVSS